MTLMVCGLHYTGAPITLREQLCTQVDRLNAALQAQQLERGIGECQWVILATCNRFEIIGEFADGTLLCQVLETVLGDSFASYSAHLRWQEGKAAVQHLMKVACGLDSMVLGEPQILGQMKMAYAQALAQKTCGKTLSRLFEWSFKVAKQVRTHTRIGAEPVSVAFAAIKLAKRIFAHLSEKTVLLIGAGEMTQLCAQYLHQDHVKCIFANRTLSKAQHYAEVYQGQAIALNEIEQQLSSVDMVISATASPEPLIHKQAVAKAMQARKHRPMILMDLAVPRDIASDIKNMDDVYLYDIDALNGIVQAGQAARAQAVNQALELLSAQTNEYWQWYESQNSIPCILAYRAHHEKLRDEALHKAQRAIDRGQPIHEVLKRLANQLTQQMLHVPTVELRQSRDQPIFTLKDEIK